MKEEIRDNLLRKLANDEVLFPRIVGYDDTLSGNQYRYHMPGMTMLFLERRPSKKSVDACLVHFLDEYVPYLVIPDCPVHEDPFRPITEQAKRFLEGRSPHEIQIAWWSAAMNAMPND